MFESRDKNLLSLFAAFIGGCAGIGLMMLGMAVVVAITSGINYHVLVLFGVFGVSGLISYLTLRYKMRRLEKDVLKQLGIDDG